MRVGVGLPTTIAGAPAALTVAWARRAEARGLASLAVHDRVAYPGLEPMVALGAAAAVTERVRLASLVLIAPLRATALLAKQAESLTALSSARFSLGLGIGPRRDDYDLAGRDFAQRGRIFDSQLRALREAWGTTCPPGAEPELIVGGAGDQALLRMVRWADGFCHGGGPPRAFRSAADRVRAAWSDAGRPGQPRLWGMGYFALGDGAAEQGREDLRRYYTFMGAFAERVAAGLLTSGQAIREFVGAYAEAGCEDLVLFPTVADLGQVERLAEALEAG